VSIKIRLLLFGIVLIWTLGIFIEFIIPLNSKFILIIPWLHQLYSLVCHQEPQKLITIAHKHTLTCARCSGIYVGGLISSFILIFVNIKNPLKLKYLIFAVIPMLFDVFLYSAGLYSYSKIIAFITGLLLGSTGFLYIHEGILNFINESKLKGKII